MASNVEIGGYFEMHLDSQYGLPYRGIYFNLGRSAFEYALKARKAKRVWLPEFNCPTLIPAAESAGAKIVWYRVDEQLYPQFPPEVFSDPDDAVLIVNYFGLRNDLLKKYAGQRASIIWDFAQALYCVPPADDYTVCYSPRKFLGIVDGGILWGKGFSAQPSGIGHSQAFNKVSRMVKRYDTGAASGYRDFHESEDALSAEGCLLMSRFSQALLASINLGKVAQTRLGNYRVLHQQFKKRNRLVLVDDPEQAPLVYPLLLDPKQAGAIRKKLIQNQVYVAKYWPFDGLKVISEQTLILSESILALPIDQRYGVDDMHRIIQLMEG